MHAMKVDSFQPMLVNVSQFHRFTGRYYLTGVVTKSSDDGLPFTRLTLSDASGDLQVFTQNPELITRDVQPNQLVHVEAALQQRKGRAFFRCKNLMDASTSQSIGEDLASLPKSLCPLPEVFDAFFIMVNRVRNPLLHKFLNRVLLQPHIGVRFLQCPASLKHHHSYPGGLLKHSVEVAWQLYSVQAFSRMELDIAVTSALLHDIGKTLTMTPDLKRSSMGKMVDHAQLTLEICADALKELDESSPHLANQLRHAWTCYSPGARFGFKPKTQVAATLQRVDGLSAERELDISHVNIEYSRI